jgi:hypothetical protein
VYYLKCLSVLWENGYSTAAQLALYGLLLALALYGAWTRISCRLVKICSRPLSRSLSDESAILDKGSDEGRDEKSDKVPDEVPDKVSVSRIPRTSRFHQHEGTFLLEIFTVLYFLFIILFPWGGRRYLMPIMPIFVLCALVGMRALTVRWPASLRIALQGGLALTVAATFILKYTTVSWREIAGGMQTKEVTELIEYVRNHAAPESTFVFRKARFLALYSGLRCSDIYEEDDAERPLAFYRQIGASHVISSNVFRDDAEQALADLVWEHPGQFEQVYRNAAFAVYRFR